MKKSDKIVLTIAGVCLGLGLVLTISGTLLGARFATTNFGLMQIDLYGMNMDFMHRNRQGNAMMDSPDHYTQGGGWRTTLQESYGASQNLISKIDISAGMGEVKITEGKEFAIYVTGNDNGPEIYSKVENGTWTVETRNEDQWLLQNSKLTINITLPRGYTATHFAASIGMGSLEADEIRAQEMTLEVGAGEISVDEAEISRTTVLICGMGQIDIDGGNLFGNTAVECGMGQVNLEIDGRQSDYGCKAEVGMGQVTFGENSVGGVGGDREWNTNSSNLLDISCAMGQVTVDFS